MTSPITSTAEQLKLDDTPLKFGKYKGSTPNEILENYGTAGASYIVWMYKKVQNFPTCSPTLAKIAAGERLEPEQLALKEPPNYKVRSMPPGFEDLEDDVPF